MGDVLQFAQGGQPGGARQPSKLRQLGEQNLRQLRDHRANVRGDQGQKP